jgi:DNA-binding NarL/FixJ family response regulator
MTNKTLSVNLVENNELLLLLVSNLIKTYPVDLLNSSSTYEAALKAFNQKNSDVVILDLDLGEGPSGYNLALMMRQLKSNLGIVFYSSFNDERFIINGNNQRLTNYVFLRKSEIINNNAIYNAILQSIEILEEENKFRKKEVTAFYKNFNDREIELMAHVAAGFSNKKIASIFKIEIKSCENAISRLAKKLNLPQEDLSNQRIMITRKYLQLCGKEI